MKLDERYTMVAKMYAAGVIVTSSSFICTKECCRDCNAKPICDQMESLAVSLFYYIPKGTAPQFIYFQRNLLPITPFFTRNDALERYPELFL